MILVTGGSGYIGSYIIKELSNQKISYNNLDLQIGLDIRNIDDIRQVFKTNKYDAVIHCAALKDAPESLERPFEYYETNVIGTINLLKVMKEFNCNKIIFSSTAAMYGNGVSKETDILNPETPYASSKRTCEEIIKYSGIDYVIFRYFNVAGHDKIDGTMLIHRIKSKTKVIIFGDDYETRDGTCIRDYIHVEDLAKAHILALKHNENNIFNLGTNNGYTIKEICEEARCDYEIGNRREKDIIISIADNTKASRLLKWKPKKELKDILKEE